MWPHAKLGLVCNNLSSFGLLLHWLHVSLLNRALTLCHNSSPGNFCQGTVFTIASKDFLEKLFTHLTRSRARCTRGV